MKTLSKKSAPLSSGFLGFSEMLEISPIFLNIKEI